VLCPYNPHFKRSDNTFLSQLSSMKIHDPLIHHNRNVQLLPKEKILCVNFNNVIVKQILKIFLDNQIISIYFIVL